MTQEEKIAAQELIYEIETILLDDHVTKERAHDLLNRILKFLKIIFP